MNQTLISKKRFAIIYGSLWAIFALFFAFVLRYSYKIPTGAALADSLLSALLLSLVLLSFWFIIRYSDPGEGIGKTIILRSLALLGLILPLWVFVSVSLLDSLVYSPVIYADFLQQTYLIRAFFGALMGLVVFLSLTSLNLKRSTKEALQRESYLKDLVQQTELQALKNQLNPHFIYNSLNSISSLTITAPEKAQAMVIRLSEFLRYALSQDANHLATLEEELENVRLYLQIEQVRFGERLQFELQIAEEHLQWRLPVMILQPLFENAVKHGLQKSAVKGKIVLSSQKSALGLKLSLVNAFDPQFARYRGEGVGLENIRNRLRLIYGNGQLLQLQAGEAEFTATLELPERH